MILDSISMNFKLKYLGKFWAIKAWFNIKLISVYDELLKARDFLKYFKHEMCS